MARERLKGQRALVTGASSGIGEELARRLAAEGANLVITARRKERLEGLANELRQAHGVDVRVIASDLEDPAAAQRLFDETEGAGLAVDVLVNNAGFGAYLDFVEVDWARYQGILQVNVIALTELSRLFLPKMVERRHGHLMNVASMGAYMPCPSFAVYAATKAYVRNLTEAIDYELKGTGVRAIVINPGPTQTEFMDHANQKLKSGSDLALMSAKRCANIAVDKMLAGRRTVITGFLNAFSMFLLRFVPRCWMPFLAKSFMDMGVESVKPAALPAGPPPARLPGPAAEEPPAADPPA
ncbi:MAG: SDR family NAD(P)-dependent oxidoreductase [Planctomycetota bacterium]